MFGSQKEKNELLKNLFCAVTEEEILKFDGVDFWIGKNKLPIKDVETILAEARAMSDMYLWKLLLNDAKWLSNQRMYEKAENFEDMIFGKACLYIIDVLQKKVANLSKMQYGKGKKSNKESKKS